MSKQIQHDVPIVPRLLSDARARQFKWLVAEEVKFKEIKQEAERRLTSSNMKSAMISYSLFYKEYKEALWIVDPDEKGLLN